MKKNCSKKLSSVILCMALIVAMALVTAGCKDSSGNGTPTGAGPKDNTEDIEKATQLGEGSTKFTFSVVDKEGSETWFEIHTDQETVGKALLELDLIAGEESAYGLFVKTVNGITADYDKDGVYWAFYINDEYAQTGVDSTTITEGDSYSFRIE